MQNNVLLRSLILASFVVVQCSKTTAACFNFANYIFSQSFQYTICHQHADDVTEVKTLSKTRRDDHSRMRCRLTRSTTAAANAWAYYSLLVCLESTIVNSFLMHRASGENFIYSFFLFFIIINDPKVCY